MAQLLYDGIPFFELDALDTMGRGAQTKGGILLVMHSICNDAAGNDNLAKPLSVPISRACAYCARTSASPQGGPEVFG